MGLVLAGAFMWAVGQVMMRRLGEIGGVTAIAWVSVMAAPQLLAASLLLEEGHVAHIQEAGLQVWGAVIYLGLIMTAIGYACWYHILGRYEVNKAGPFILLTPVTSVIGGALFLGEEITVYILAGGALVMLGVAAIVFDRGRPAPVPAPAPEEER